MYITEIQNLYFIFNDKPNNATEIIYLALKSIPTFPKE